MKRVLAVAVAVVLTACGGATGNGVTGNGASTTIDHAVALADHETTDLAANLTPVAGYAYVDVPAAELESALARLHGVEQEMSTPGFFAGVSLHGIVADDPSQNLSGTRSGRPEVGLLQLYAYSSAPPYGTEATATFFARTMGSSSTGAFTASGTRVFAFEDPTRPDSRYWYLWMRHGVTGAVDGADAAALERWVRSYLAAPGLSRGETATLAARLAALPSYGFVNYDGPALEQGVAETFGAVPHSIHKVVDDTGSFATLTLVEPGRQATPEIVSSFFEAGGVPATATGVRSVAGATVGTYGDGSEMVLYAWTGDGVVGIAGTSEASETEAFLAELFGAWEAAGFSRPAAVDTPAPAAASTTSAAPSGVSGPTTSVTTPPSTGVACVPPSSVATPLHESFSEPCGVLEIGSDDDHTSAVVDGAYQVVVRSEAWWTWVDLEGAAKTTTMALDATLPIVVGDIPAGMLSLICLGSTNADSYRLLVGATADRAAALIVRSPEGPDHVTLVSTRLDPAQLAEPVKIGFTCSETSAGVALVATIDGTEVLSTVDGDSTSFAPFVAVGLRFDNSSGVPVTFVLDELVVDAVGE